MSLRIGIIGLGKMGLTRARTIKAHAHTELIAISDIDAYLADAPEFTGARFFEQWEDLIATDIDAVFVCTYNHICPDIVIKALEAGKHVFCEKPAGRSVADIEAMRAKESTCKDQILKFGFNHRWHYAISEAKSLVDSGRFGDILWIRGVYGKCGSIHFEKQWRNQKELSGGGILLDQGIHMLDLFRYFLGDFAHIQSTTKTSGWNISVEDNAFAILENTRGQVALLHSSATQWKHKFRMEICLQDGYVNIGGILSSTRSYGEERLTFAKKQLEDQGHAFGKPREESIFFDRDDSWALELEEFVNAINGIKPIAHGSSQDMLAVMQLVHQIYKKSA